jgi:hypothetical protein
MPTKLILPRLTEKDDLGYGIDEGVEIVWIPTANRLDISGWYESHKIEKTSLTLRELFSDLKITEADCKKAFKDNENGQENA